YLYRSLPHLPSFPTRRSSDLQVLGEQQFLLRELLRDRLVEGRGPTRRDIFLSEAILEREIQRFHAHALGNTRDRPDHAHVRRQRSEEHTSELESRFDLVCRLL